MSTFGVFKRRKSNTDALKKSIEAQKISEKNIKSIFESCADLEQRNFTFRSSDSGGCAAFWIDGLVNSLALAEDVFLPLGYSTELARCETDAQRLDKIMSGRIFSATVRRRSSMDELVTDILMGHCALVFESAGEAITFDVKSLQTRAISEPGLEKTVKGAKDAFVETIRVNTSLVRRKLRDPRLKLEQLIVGRKSGTAVAILYIKDVASRKTVDELRKRLRSIEIDGLTATGNIEQYITDCPASPFPQLIHTERPDKFAMELLEGRVGLIADGLPIGFLLPAPMAYFMKVGDDRSNHFLVASFLTLLRWFSLSITLLLPGLLVALSMYHQEMIPTRLLLSMIESNQRVPFSPALEILGMLLAFELLQEAGLRLPSPVGDTVSIIGALIVGQAAVEARVVSPIAVIVVAAAGICGFTLPSQDMGGAVRMMRLALVLLAAAMGMFGIMLGIAALLLHLCSLESFGVAYTSPISEGGFGNILSVLTRPPLWLTKLRDPALGAKDEINQR